MLVKLIYQNVYDYSFEYDSLAIARTLSESDWEEINKEDYYFLFRSVEWFNSKDAGDKAVEYRQRILLLVKPTLNELSAASTIEEFQKELKRREIEEKEKQLLLDKEREERNKKREQKKLENKLKKLELLKKELGEQTTL